MEYVVLTGRYSSSELRYSNSVGQRSGKREKGQSRITGIMSATSNRTSSGLTGAKARVSPVLRP